MNKSFAIGILFTFGLIAACGAAGWREPPSWTIREDGRLRASQRKEDFSFLEWRDKYLQKEGKNYGVCFTPDGVKAVGDELSRRNAKIIELENKLKDCK